MRTLPSAVAAHLAAGGGVAVQVLVWLTVRDRTTGALEPFGFWTGADHQVITIGEEARTYYGGGAMITPAAVTSATAQLSRSWQLTVSKLDPAVAEAVRVYDARMAPFEVHEWLSDPVTNLPLAEPQRVVRGTVMDLSIPTPPAGQQAEVTIRVVTDAYRLTRGLTLKRSNTALEARTVGADLFRRYGDLKGIPVAWGEFSTNDASLLGNSAPPNSWKWAGGAR